MHRVVRKRPTPSPFDAELGNRLMRIYGLGGRPRNPDDFFRLLKAESSKHSGTKEFLKRVRSKEAVIGRSDVPTKDWIALGRSEKVFTFCSYDTLMTAILRGRSQIGSLCPHCGEAMKVRIRESKLAYFSPKGMVFFWGTGPEGSPGNPMCDHLHLFPDMGHRQEWVKSREGEMGFEFELSEAVLRLNERF